jgi:peptidoglycan/xylan/chitin deacetylase (PgdA/CDA1 family)
MFWEGNFMLRFWMGFILPIFCVGFVYAEAPSGSPAPLSMGFYQQTIRITFKTQRAAEQASLHIVPLYHDAKLAFSTRMDDNNIDDLKVAEVMATYHQKGTFFLNDPKGWQGTSDAGITVVGDPAVEVPKRLIAEGHSIGVHTLNHEYLPALSKNAAFKEILGLRVKREAYNGTPLSSFTYPFVSFHSEGMDPQDREDIEEMLRRSGIYLLSENRYNGVVERGFFDGYFVTTNGQNWNGSEVGRELAKERLGDDRPLFLVTMHPWAKTWGGKDYPKLAEVYEKWSGQKDWWYCNQNQYAAYRVQATHTTMAVSNAGNTLIAVLTRPLPADLGDWVPLTFEVEGVKKDEVQGVACTGAKVQRVEKSKTFSFDLSHDAAQGPIESYAEISQVGNVDRWEDAKEGPNGLRSSLNRTEEGLSLVIQNGGTVSLKHIRVTFRLPLRWKEGVIRKTLDSLEKDSSVTFHQVLTERTDSAHYKDGSEYLVAQVDYMAAKPSRLYVVQETPSQDAALFFARNGFWVLGPLPGDSEGFDPLRYASIFLNGKKPTAHNPVAWGADLMWKTPSPSLVSILDPDIVPTTGKPATPSFYSWDASIFFPHKKVHYMLWGQVESPVAQTVKAVFLRDSVKALSLNGKEVEGDVLVLKKGVNDLRILYAPAANQWSEFSEKNYGCYLRLMDEKGNRLENVHFTRPTQPE